MIDLQPLSGVQHAELRKRVIAAVSNAIGSPYPYVSVVIRESEPSNIVEAGGRVPMTAASRSPSLPVSRIERAAGAVRMLHEGAPHADLSWTW